MRVVAAALCLALVAGCHHKKTDAERAAEERAAARARLEKSLVLVPYRSLKTVVRASRQQPPPPELEKLIAIWAGMRPATWSAPSGSAFEDAKQIAALGVGLVRARSTLKDIDEDKFPTLWTVFMSAPTPLRWYSARVEHLGLAVAAWLFEVSLNKDPVADVLFYELDRAPAEAGWPPPLRIGSRGARGVAYLNAGYHYAAEEELTGYLADVDGFKDPDQPWLKAGGHLARAWNRFALDRDEPANDDLEAALHELDALGVDNELVDWGWALVHVRRGRYPEAGQRLDKLAASPYLDDKERAEVKEFAQALDQKKGRVLFGKQRAQLILVRAVIARNGGLEKVLGKLLGDETGRQVYAPLAYFHKLQARLSK